MVRFAVCFGFPFPHHKRARAHLTLAITGILRRRFASRRQPRSQARFRHLAQILAWQRTDLRRPLT
jgi:hypothetical protein